jgi:hypothetical protein
MSTQIFKNSFPNEILINLLDNIALKTDKCYVINTASYKKGVFNETISKFIEECKPFYHLSKQKYLERKLTYNSFVTVLRQICNYNKITYTSQIKYDKSTYNIVYYIYFFNP